ncbi:MAG TPA: corrinoid protein [Thermoleophilia bacterium]|nr:corrinoid protein [Thermoleophilia bacterium]
MVDARTEPALAGIVKAFTGAEYERIPGLVEEGLRAGMVPEVLLDGGLVAGIREVGEMFRRGEAFLPEMMLAAEALESGMAVLEPLMAGHTGRATKGKVVIGTVKGDIHSLGKNIVATLLRTAGFEVIDLGVDVPASRFVAAASEAHADVIAACALMTTTLPQQQEVIEHLQAAGRRQDFFVMVGGASATPEWATQIGADAYGATAADAVVLAEEHSDRAHRS